MAETISELLNQGRRDLEACYPNPRFEAELLLAAALGQDRAHLYACPEANVDASSKARFVDFVARRAEGVPLAYLTGQKEFWSLSLQVTPDTLIPRPETELLVDLALERAAGNARIADLGTGSGAIAIALATELNDAALVATDVSDDALSVARANAAAHQLENIEFRLGRDSDWFSALADEQFDVIVSNPPYVSVDDPALTSTDIRFEPQDALAAGPDGLDALRQIISGARPRLNDQGFLMVEHGNEQGNTVRQLFLKAGFAGVATRCDLAGHERVTLGQLLPPRA